MKFGLFYEHQLPKPYDAAPGMPATLVPMIEKRA